MINEDDPKILRCKRCGKEIVFKAYGNFKDVFLLCKKCYNEKKQKVLP